jgi:alkylation response protein AidB-like acyl-CoA dehydrogenase
MSDRGTAGSFELAVEPPRDDYHPDDERWRDQVAGLYSALHEHAREFLRGNGILLEYNVGRFVADAEAIYSYEGTREMNTLIVGKAITGTSAFAG